MSRASEDLVDQLHGMQAEALLEELRAYRAGEKVDKDGNVLPVPGQLFAQINKFLKDNGVDRAVRPGDPTDLLADEMPDFEDTNITAFPTKR